MSRPPAPPKSAFDSAGVCGLAGGVPDETDPPRKNYGFKEREFKRDERPSSASRPPVTTQDLAKLAGPVAHSGQNKVFTPKPDDPNDIHAVLQQNRGAEKKFGGDDVEIQVIKSRRKRDYWFLLITGNLAIVVPCVLLGLNPMTFVFGLAGTIIYSLGLTWVMWQVMGKY